MIKAAALFPVPALLAAWLVLSLPAPVSSQGAPPLIQSVFTTDDSGNEKRVFKINTPVSLHVVVRNTSGQSMTVNYGDLRGFIFGARSGSACMMLPAPSNNDAQVDLQPGEYHCFVFDFPAGFNPTWSAAGFPMVGDRMTVSLRNGVNWDFYVDEFGVPEWTRSANAVGLGKFGGDCMTPLPSQDQIIDLSVSSITPFKLFESEFYTPLLQDLNTAGVEAVFIGPEYYNYATLEGGVHFFDCQCQPLLESGGFDLSKCRLQTEPFLHYWFPAGPTALSAEGTEYNYLTPPLRIGSCLNLDGYGRLKAGAQYLSVEVRREKIRNFVRAAHDVNIKVIAYVDFLGIYDPDSQVERYETRTSPCPSGTPGAPTFDDTPDLYTGRVLERSASTLSERQRSDAAWVRLDRITLWDQLNNVLSPVRVNFIDNELGALHLRDLNPTNYAVAPALYDPRAAYEGPREKSPGLDRSSYRDYISSQCGLLVSDLYYGFDAIFCDDIGRFAQRPCNISMSLNKNPNPCVMYSCDPLPSESPCEHGYRKILSAVKNENCPQTEKDENSPQTWDCWREYVFGCQPNDSWYAGNYCRSGLATDLQGDARNRHVKGAIAEFMRYCRHRIKAWGGTDKNEKALISSDYYVPWPEVAACADASSTDLFPILSEYQAQWCDSTYGSAFKGMRLDFNQQCNTESEEMSLAHIGVAWANRCVFWIGGDKSGLNALSGALAETRFSKTRYGQYCRFYKKWKAELANPLLETKYHGLTNRNAMLKLVPSSDQLYAVMHSKPCSYGEDYRLIFLINLQRACPSRIDLTMPLPAGERIASITHLSPDFSATNDFLNGRSIREASEQTSLIPSHYTLESGEVTITLKDIIDFSILKIMFEDAFTESLSIESASPSDGVTDAPRSTSVSVTFDKPIDASTVNGKSFRLHRGLPSILGSFSFEDSDHAVIFQPSRQLNAGSKYSVTLTTDIAGQEGATLRSDTTWSFTTASDKEDDEEEGDNAVSDLLNISQPFSDDKQVTHYLELSGKGYDIAGTSLGNIALSTAYFFNNRFGIGAKASYSLFSDTVQSYRLEGTTEYATILYINLNPSTKVFSLDFPRFELSLWYGYGIFRFSTWDDFYKVAGQEREDDFQFFDQMLCVYWRYIWDSRRRDGSSGNIFYRIARRANGIDIGGGVGYRSVIGLNNGGFSNSDLSTIHGMSYIRLVFR